jgi:predicted phosphoribosyltransferase
MFRNRKDAGKKLAQALKKYTHLNPIVLALPRGGVPIGYEIARELNAPLEVLIVRKIGAPWNPEFGVGAIAEGVQFLDEETLTETALKPSDLKALIERETIELKRRNHLYRGDHKFPNLEGRVVVLVDDGIATGASIQTALQALSKMKPSQVILAIPVAAKESLNKIRKQVDVIICLEVPEHFYAVGAFYHDFPQVSDKEVIELLKR